MDDKFEYIKEKLTDIFAKVTIDNSIGLLDINKRSENIFMHVLNSIYGWNLKNANLIKENFPAIDLIDDKKKIVVQVTSTTDTSKVRHTIKKLKELDDYKDYELKIFYIKKKPKFQRESLKEFAKEGLLSDDLLGIKDILEEVESDLDICTKVYDTLQKIFEGEQKYTIEVNGNIIGVGVAQKGANITQNIYATVNPEILITHITQESINQAKEIDDNEKKSLEKKFYFIDDSYETIFNVVCNNLDVKNDALFEKLDQIVSSLSNVSYWLLGNGGEGKSTTLVRLAVESAISGKSAFYMDFENPSLKEESIPDILTYISNTTQNKAHIFIDNPDIKVPVLEVLFREIVKSDFEFVIILAERKNRYEYLKENNKNAIYVNNQSVEENSFYLGVSQVIKEEVYKRFYALLDKKDIKIEKVISSTIKEKNLAFVNATYSILNELSHTSHIDYKFDWLEYKSIAEKNFQTLKDSYKYISFFYYFRIKMPFSFFENLYSSEKERDDLKAFIAYFSSINRGDSNKEPIIFETVKKSLFQTNYFLRTKHEIISELFFKNSGYHQNEFTEILIDILKVFDENDIYQVDTLVDFFGNKRMILDKERIYRVNFSFVEDILRDLNLSQKFKINSKLYGSIHMARFWELLGDNQEKAISFLEKSLICIPNNLHFRTELAKIYQVQNKYAKAEKVLLESLAIDNKHLHGRTELARVYRVQHKYNKVEKLLLESLKIDDTHLHSRAELAKVYQEQSMYDEAIKYLKEYIELDPKGLYPRIELAKVYQEQKKYEDAEKVLLDLLEIDKNSLYARSQLARVYRVQHKYNKVEKLLLESLKIDNTHLHSRVELAKVYQEKKRYNEAIKYLKEYIELDPKGLHPRIELAKIYQEQKKYDEAIKYLKEYIELDPKGLHPRTELAKVYQEQNRYEDAEKVLLDLLDIEKNSLHARSQLTKIYQEQNRYADAEKVLLGLLEIDIKNLQARTELAKVYQIQNQYNKSIVILQECIEIMPKDIMSRDILARIYINIKEYNNAEKMLLDILKISKFDFYAISSLVWLYTIISKPRKAFCEIDRFLSNDRLKFFGGNKSRKHQNFFYNIFFLCKRCKYFDKAKVYFNKYEYLLNDSNLNQYKNDLKNKIVDFRERDLEGVVSKVGYDFIVIDNNKYSKKFRFSFEVGDKVVFDIDFDGNATNIEVLD